MPRNNSPEVSLKSLFIRAIGGGVAAALVNLALYFLARAAGVAMEGAFSPGQPPGLLPLPPVALASIVPAIPAAILAWLLARFTGDAARNFSAIAVIFTLLSFAGPAGVAGASMETKVALGLMHIVAATGIAGSIHRALRG